MADAKVLEIPEGGVLVLRGVKFTETQQSELVGGLRDAAGHGRFVILTIPDPGGVAEVWGPDVDLVAKIEMLLREHEWT